MRYSVEQPAGERIPDGGAWQLRDYDENGLCRSPNGRVTCEHKKVLRSAGDVACKGRQDFFLGGIRRWFRDSSPQQNSP